MDHLYTPLDAVIVELLAQIFAECSYLLAHYAAFAGVTHDRYKRIEPFVLQGAIGADDEEGPSTVASNKAAAAGSKPVRTVLKSVFSGSAP